MQSIHQNLPQQVDGNGVESKSTNTTLCLSEEQLYPKYLGRRNTIIDAQQISFIDRVMTKSDLRMSKEVAQSTGAVSSKYMIKSIQMLDDEKRINSAARMSKEDRMSLDTAHSKRLYTLTHTVMKDSEQCSKDSAAVRMEVAEFLDVSRPVFSKEWLFCQHCDYVSDALKVFRSIHQFISVLIRFLFTLFL